MTTRLGVLRRPALAVAGRLYPRPAATRWIFIGRTSNSGTSLVQKLLAQHPDVASLPIEGQALTNRLPLADGADAPTRLWALAPDLFHLTESDLPGAGDAVVRHWSRRLNDRRRPVALEKSPPNLIRTRWLQANFADPLFVIMIRDAQVVAEGIRRRVGHDLATATQQWVRAHELFLADRPHLRRCLVVKYEDLVADPAGQLAAILDVARLDPARVDFESLTASVAGRNAGSLDRLTAQERRAVRLQAGDVMAQLGYELRP